jgi:hypothetical protein
MLPLVGDVWHLTLLDNAQLRGKMEAAYPPLREVLFPTSNKTILGPYFNLCPSA